MIERQVDDMTEWLTRILLDVDMVYFAKPSDHELYATCDVRIKLIDGQISLGGKMASRETPKDNDNVIIELWTQDDDVIEIGGMDVDFLVDDNPPAYFNAVSVPGRTRIVFSKNSGNVTKQIALSL